MTKQYDVYKCEVCGNVVEVLHAGGGNLVCCEKPMILQKPNFEDAAEEKHVPVLEKTEKGLVIKVGEAAHPMEAEHYIMWIEARLGDGNVTRVDLKPGDASEMRVCNCNIDSCCCKVEEMRAYCNIHGLWSNHE